MKTRPVLLAPVIAGISLLLTTTSVSATPTVSFDRTDFASGATPFAVAAGDLNGDAVPDLVTANYGANTVSVRLGLGGGTFGPPVDYPTELQPVSVAIGDLNNDAIPELAVCNWGSGTVSIFPGLGGGTFGTRADLSAGGTRPISGRFVHLNIDGNLDFVFALRDHAQVTVWMGNGAGSFMSTTSYSTAPVSFPYSIGLGDFHGDGQIDMIVGTDAATNQVVVLPGHSGVFFPATTWTVGVQPIGVGFADFNNDAMDDMFTANQADGTVSLRYADGSNGFGPKVDYPVGTGPFSIVHGYLNGDIDRDLAVVNGGANTISILLGDGAGGFLPKVDFATGTAPRGITTAELNGDIHLDLAVANSGANSASVFLNDSDPSELPCPASVVANGDFARGLVVGSMPTWGFVDSWSALSESPQVLGEGCGNIGSMQMWGNLAIGESIKQRLPGAGLQAGRTYQITLCAKWLDGGNPVAPQYVRFRLAASASEPVAYPIPAGYTVVGITPNLTSTSWASFVLPNFTAPTDLNWITVNPENDFNINDGNYMSWGVIDDICIQELSPTSAEDRLDLVNGWNADGRISPALTLLSVDPNPSNGPASIRFALARPAPVEMRVHDILGAEVYRQRSVALPAGSHMLRWDGRLSDGGEAPGGVYFYLVSAGVERVKGKVIVVR